MFGFSDIIRFTHAMESLLDLMRDGKISAASTLTDLLLRATDILRTHVFPERRETARRNDSASGARRAQAAESRTLSR
jgi:two-component system chemotaxis sensor kinase CheA